MVKILKPQEVAKLTFNPDLIELFAAVSQEENANLTPVLSVLNA